MPKSMKVQFDFTLEDMTDVTLRSAQNSPFFRRANVRNALTTGMILGFLIFIFLPGSIELRTIFGLLGAVMGSFIGYDNRLATRWYRVQASMQEWAGTDRPLICTVTIDPLGVTASQLDSTTTRPWSAFRSAVNGMDAIELVSREGVILAVRNQAFISDIEQTAFLELARGYMEECNRS